MAGREARTPARNCNVEDRCSQQHPDPCTRHLPGVTAMIVLGQRESVFRNEKSAKVSGFDIYFVQFRLKFYEVKFVIVITQISIYLYSDPVPARITHHARNTPALLSVGSRFT